jgi:hypothetical protein
MTDRHAQGSDDRCDRWWEESASPSQPSASATTTRDYDVRIVDMQSDYGMSVKVNMPLYSMDFD